MKYYKRWFKEYWWRILMIAITIRVVCVIFDIEIDNLGYFIIFAGLVTTNITWIMATQKKSGEPRDWYRKIKK